MIKSAKEIIDSFLSVLSPLIGEIYGLDIVWDIDRGLFFSLYCRGYVPTEPAFEVVGLDFGGRPFLVLTPPGKNLNFREVAEVEAALQNLLYVN